MMLPPTIRSRSWEAVNVVVSAPSGFAWTAATDASGRYAVTGVTARHYLPMVARAGYLDAVATGDGPLGRWRSRAGLSRRQW